MIDATQQPAQRAVQLLSQAQYARLIGVNRSTISRQVASGLIPTHNGLIDPVEADAARKANLDLAKQRFIAVRESERVQPAPEAPPPVLISAPSSPVAQTLPFDEPAPAAGTLKAAQVDQAEIKAELLRMQLAKEKGEFVSARDVELAWSEMVLNARNRLMQIPDEIEDATTRARVTRRILDVLNDLSGHRATAEQAA